MEEKKSKSNESYFPLNTAVVPMTDNENQCLDQLDYQDFFKIDLKLPVL